LSLDDRRHRRDGAEHPFAERDDGQQAVPLGDVVRMPGRAAARARAPRLRILQLGRHRPAELDQMEHRSQRECPTELELQHRQHDPADLGNHDEALVASAT
jgi:hypothetical protein